MLTKLTPIFCLMTHTAVVSHFLLLVYKLSGSEEITVMMSKFSEHQKKMYKEIQIERRNHYIYGLLMGITCAILYIGLFPKTLHPICTYIGIATMIAQNFYLLLPKSKWMIDYLENPQDIYTWNQVYKKFRYISAYGTFLGFIFYVVGRI